jgi:hypothetical protein
MGSDANGITQSPFTDAWSTPAVGGTGLNGIGGGLEADAGPNGIVNSPFDKAWPTPGTQETPCADLGQPAPTTVQVTDAPGKGSHQPWDVTSSRNTVDQR